MGWQAVHNDYIFIGLAHQLLVDLVRREDLDAFFGFRFLPRAVTKPWLKLVYTVTGTAPTTGKVFAALLREEQDSYEAGQYINQGRVIG